MKKFLMIIGLLIGRSSFAQISSAGETTAAVIVNVAQSVRDSLTRVFPAEKAYLDVPFFCQAPFMNMESWNVHRESCEEAAVLQVVYYLRGVTKMDLSEIDKTIRKMIDWQMIHFKGHHDIRTDSVKILINGFFGYSDNEIRIIRHATIQDVKDQVLKGNPVIAMANGYVLNNPHYVENLRARRMSGYHMLVVKGFDKDKIITNDVGTMRGNDYSYPYNVFQRAMDYHGGDVMVIVPKESIPQGQSSHE